MMRNICTESELKWYNYFSTGNGNFELNKTGDFSIGRIKDKSRSKAAIMKSLQTFAILVVCAFIFMGAKCEWFPDEEATSEPESETVVIISADVLANIQSIDTVNDEMDVLTTGPDGKELTLDLPTTPTLAVDDLIEIEITFEGVNDEYHITDAVFVQLL